MLREARANFVESCAAYSVVCYLLQVCCGGGHGEGLRVSREKRPRRSGRVPIEAVDSVVSVSCAVESWKGFHFCDTPPILCIFCM